MEEALRNITCVCFYCGMPQKRFVKIPISKAERQNSRLQFACARCALRMQRGGEIVDASRVMHFYLGNTRGMLSKILKFYELVDINTSRYGESGARWHRRDVTEMEMLREKMETLHESLCTLFRVNGLDQPNPGWVERYAERARRLGCDTALYPETVEIAGDIAPEPADTPDELNERRQRKLKGKDGSE